LEAIMKTATIPCNAALAALSLLIVVTEGLPNGAIHRALTGLIIVVPILTVYAVTRTAGGAGPGVRLLAVLGNLSLLGLVCWAIVTQYPYPEGPSVIPFAMLAVFTPGLSLAVLLSQVRGGQRDSCRRA
jgi:hypothetical protein